MKHYFLGEAAGYSRKARLHHTFTIGRAKDSATLRHHLAHRYFAAEESVALTKNGRSALALALKATLPKRSKIIVNAFTCYAVVEAIRAADCIPIFADIDESTLNFTTETIKKVLTEDTKAIIIQNTFGNPVDIKSIEKLAKIHDLKLIEDLAHCAGFKYSDGREVGTVGIATALSFGKDKSIDTISGGAVIIRDPLYGPIGARTLAPKFSDTFRARFYPLFGAIYRTLSYIKLEKAWMWLLLKLHFVERSADNSLDLERRPAHFEAKLALEKFQKLSPRRPLRDYRLVNNREVVLKKLREAGYFFDGFWYEKPVSPTRYYHKVHFPEAGCPVAMAVSNSIVNFPNYYPKKSLSKAYKIVEEYQK